MKFREYCAALGRIPQTAVEEHRQADGDPMLTTMIIDRRGRIDALWREWVRCKASS